MRIVLLALAAAAGHAGATLLQAPPSAERRWLEDSLRQAAGGPEFLLAALGVAFFLGAAHALTPGHGKTIVAAYLVGSGGTVWDAVYLGSVVTITHTSSVFVLGFLALYASRHILIDRIYPWLSLVSGLLVVGMGAWLLYARWRALRHGHQHHHHHHHEHGHSPDHGHHHSPPHPASLAVSRKQLLSLGVSGGLVPCPEALVVLLLAVSIKKLGLGLIILVAFSLGLAAVLIAIGAAMILSAPLLARFSGEGALSRIIPVGSAAAVTVLGGGIVYRAVADGGWLRF